MGQNYLLQHHTVGRSWGTLVQLCKFGLPVLQGVLRWMAGEVQQEAELLQTVRAMYPRIELCNELECILIFAVAVTNAAARRNSVDRKESRCTNSQGTGTHAVCALATG